MWKNGMVEKKFGINFRPRLCRWVGFLLVLGSFFPQAEAEQRDQVSSQGALNPTFYRFVQRLLKNSTENVLAYNTLHVPYLLCPLQVHDLFHVYSLSHSPSLIICSTVPMP